ncbi:VanZ family protein [Paenibacillus albiflavus]|uniref:VanZ family protein n=1 Tax=Paenibacillus albiflavus TaxID=2545760 RepID=A0A4V2WN57_9BACL|nr:VanZ family protein [Paenibacillus albiflavus]TCZ74232.1 VanZ family protein [Paenibacillus albiflavus]
MKNRRYWIWLALTVIWMVIIFVKSAEPYSQQDLRPRLAEWISEEQLSSVLPNLEFHYDGELITYHLPYDMLEFMIRKMGHMFEFALLAQLSLLTLRAKHVNRGAAITIAALFTCLYAISDEWHQTFIVGRTGHAIDVVVDSIGILLVVICYVAYIGLRSNKKR